MSEHEGKEGESRREFLRYVRECKCMVAFNHRQEHITCNTACKQLSTTKCMHIEACSVVSTQT